MACIEGQERKLNYFFFENISLKLSLNRKENIIYEIFRDILEQFLIKLLIVVFSELFCRNGRQKPLKPKTNTPN